MKPYIIAALLFVTGFLVLGVLTADLMAPPKPKPQAHAVQPPKTGGGYGASGGPAEASYPAATPSTHPGGMQPGGPGTASTMPSMAGAPSTGMSGGSSAMPGASGSLGVSTAVQMPKPPPITPTNSVPIIQPDDLGSGSSPTRGRVHQ